jgi:hypothetical protein
MIATLEHQIGYSQLLDSYTYLDFRWISRVISLTTACLIVFSLKVDPGQRDSIYHHLVALQEFSKHCLRILPAF